MQVIYNWLLEITNIPLRTIHIKCYNNNNDNNNNNNNSKFQSNIINVIAINALSNWNNAHPVNCDETNAGARSFEYSMFSNPFHVYILQYKAQLVRHHYLATFAQRANLDIFRLSIAFRLDVHIILSFKCHSNPTEVQCVFFSWQLTSPVR